MTLLNDMVPAAAQPHALLADAPALTPAALADLHRALAAAGATAATRDAAAHGALECGDGSALDAAPVRFSHTRGLRWLFG